MPGSARAGGASRHEVPRRASGACPSRPLSENVATLTLQERAAACSIAPRSCWPRIPRGTGIAAICLADRRPAPATARSRAATSTRSSRPYRPARSRRQCRRLPHHVDCPVGPEAAQPRGRADPRRHHRQHLAAVPRRRRRARARSRPSLDRRAPRCASSIPAACRSSITERDAFALWQEDEQRFRHRRGRHRAGAVRRRAASRGCRSWSARAPRRRPRPS